MSANCNYLYTTDGSRWEGGTIEVTHLDERNTTSRIGPDDIGKLRKEFGRKAVITVHCVTRSGERIPMQIDLARAKGRSGRRGQKIESTYLERLDASCKGDRKRIDAILREQLRTLPYGEKNADAAVERMKVALDRLEHGTVARMLASLEAPHILTVLARACADGTYYPPTPHRGAALGREGLSSLDALVIRSLLPKAQAILEFQNIPLEPLERFLRVVEGTPVLLSRGTPRLDGVDSLSVADLVEMCEDVDVLSLLSSSIQDDRHLARLAQRRFREVYFEKYGGPAPDLSEYADLPEDFGAVGRRRRIGKDAAPREPVRIVVE